MSVIWCIFNSGIELNYNYLKFGNEFFASKYRDLIAVNQVFNFIFIRFYAGWLFFFSVKGYSTGWWTKSLFYVNENVATKQSDWLCGGNVPLGGWYSVVGI